MSLKEMATGCSPYFGAGEVQPEQPVQELEHIPLQPEPQLPLHAAVQVPPQPPVQLPEQPEQLPVQLPTQVLVHVPEQPVQDREQPDEQFQLHVPPQSNPALLYPPRDVVALYACVATCEETLAIVATVPSTRTRRSRNVFAEIMINILF